MVCGNIFGGLESAEVERMLGYILDFLNEIPVLLESYPLGNRTLAR